MSIFAGVETISLTRHASQRWDARTAPDSVAPETAWREAWPVAIDAPAYRHMDEIRFHNPTGTALLASLGSLVTVIDVRAREFGDATPQCAYALRKAIAAQYPESGVVVPSAPRGPQVHAGPWYVQGWRVEMDTARVTSAEFEEGR